MATVSIGNRQITINNGQSVLDALLDAKVKIPHSCRAGVCQSCLTRAKSGELPLAAQAGLKETLKRQNYFLACCCYPDQDLVISSFDPVCYNARVKKLVQLSPNVLEVHLDPGVELEYRAGQYLTLWCNKVGKENEGRCYSIASVPALDGSLIIQIAKVENGCVSTWAHEQLTVGQQVSILKPTGDCFFVPQNAEQPILLAGSGTGLAPLFGIARDALHQRHHGEIHLFHNANNILELYLGKKLKKLAALYPQFHYYPSVRVNEGNNLFSEQPLEEMIAEAFPTLAGWQVYLCGNPKLVIKIQKQSFLAGASMQQIFSDAFLNQYNV